MCEGINSSLGSINKISPVIDEEDNNRIYFLDETPIPNRTAVIKELKSSKVSTTLTEFQIYGYQKNNSSFIILLSVICTTFFQTGNYPLGK